MPNPPEPCQQPFSPCWCEQRPNHPQCRSLDLDGFLFPLVFVLLTLYLFWRKIKLNKNHENNRKRL